jgi:soluble lytic murein transglycosylase-like protein
MFLLALFCFALPLDAAAEEPLQDSIRSLVELARYESESLSRYHSKISTQPGLSKKNKVRYWPLILRASHVYEVDPHLVNSVVRHESNYNAGAVSSKGAQGLMQLMPTTAEEMGVRNSFDPVQNIYGGTRYLRLMIDHFGNVRSALLAYNAGPSRVAQGRIPQESQLYADRVLKTYRHLTR